MGRPRNKPAARKDLHRVGRRIRVREVRVISAEGEQLGILSIQDALRLADEASLQLVEVNPSSSPPVCKIMDYGRFKYETAKRDRDSKKTKKTQELKEVKFRPKTGTHDFEFKVKHARRFLEEGSKVRLQIQFRGRELVHPEMGKSILTRVCKIVEDIATVHTAPQMEGNRMSMILNPKPRKEGSKPKPVVARPAAVPGAASGSASGLVPEGVEPEELDEDLDDEDLDDDDDDDDDDMTDDTDGLDDVDDDDDDDMSDDTDGLDDDTDDAAT